MQLARGGGVGKKSLGDGCFVELRDFTGVAQIVDRQHGLAAVDKVGDERINCFFVGIENIVLGLVAAMEQVFAGNGTDDVEVSIAATMILVFERVDNVDAILRNDEKFRVRFTRVASQANSSPSVRNTNACRCSE